MSLSAVLKQIAQVPERCSVCGGLAGYVALPPLVVSGDRRCKDHLWPEWRTRAGPRVQTTDDLSSKFSGVFVPPNALDEARPGAPTAAPSAPVKAGPGDLFGGAL